MNSIVRIAPQADADFRAAMRHLVGGVSVITVGRGSEISGMTVTSVSSLAVDPPSVIVSINRGASSWPLLQSERAFGVNIPAADQLEIVERFAGKGGLKGAERFAGADWRKRVTGVPLLVGALAAIDCEVEEIIERHSHAIVIGRVLHLDVGPAAAALAYWQGGYVSVDRDEDMARLAALSVPNPPSRS
ncbi:flavin reductase family protein [Bradyrhizobium sp. HKCCYLS1011]|uniref:flavin reductase family protein n=1 Tax=Bradyrhizobium sp. HKCCYLS1011 TaxID=3420733 RepID=UPI003EC0135A